MNSGIFSFFMLLSGAAPCNVRHSFGCVFSPYAARFCLPAGVIKCFLHRNKVFTASKQSVPLCGTKCFLTLEQSVRCVETKCSPMRNKVFSYVGTKCFLTLKQSVFMRWNKLFSCVGTKCFPTLEQTVFLCWNKVFSCVGTNCFHALKQTVLPGETGSAS